MGDLSWTWAAIGFQTGLAYVVSLVMYQFGLVVLYGKPMTMWTAVAGVLVIAMIYMIVRKPKHQEDDIISLETLAQAQKG